MVAIDPSMIMMHTVYVALRACKYKKSEKHKRFCCHIVINKNSIIWFCQNNVNATSSSCPLLLNQCVLKPNELIIVSAFVVYGVGSIVGIKNVGVVGDC